MVSGTIAVSWGPYGGFYLHPRRVCLGWVAFTYIPRVEIDDLMEAWVKLAEVREVLHTGWLPDGDSIHIEQDEEGPWMNTPTGMWVEGL